MIRNVSLFVVGAVIGVLIFVGIGRSLNPDYKVRVLERIFSFWIPKIPKAPGPGSPVRVVGGSIKIHAKNASSINPTEIDVPTSDDTTFELEQPQTIPRDTTWTIKEFVNGATSQGVQIDGKFGTGNIRFRLIDASYAPGAPKPPDEFVSDSAGTGYLAHYSNPNCPGSGAAGSKCEKVTQISVQVGGGNAIPFSCPDGQMGVCHISIGSQ